MEWMHFNSHGVSGLGMHSLISTCLKKVRKEKSLLALIVVEVLAMGPSTSGSPDRFPLDPIGESNTPNGC